MLVSLKICMLICFLPTAMVPCFSPQLSRKLVTSSVTNGDVTFPHSPFHLNCPISTVSLLELVLSRPICFELSAFTSMVKAFYNCCKSASRKENSSCSACATFYKPLIIFFLTALFLSLYANLSLALQSAPWHVAQVLSLCEIPLRLHPLEGIA